MTNFLLANIVIVTNHLNQILMIQEARLKSRGKWFFPAGKIEPHETIRDCAKREVKEESGIDIDVEGIFYLDQITSQVKENSINRTRFFIKATHQGGQLKGNEDEHSIRAQWFTPDDISRLDLRSQVVNKAITLLSQNPPMIAAENIHEINGAELCDEET